MVDGPKIGPDGFTALDDLDAWLVEREEAAAKWLGDEAERIALKHAEKYAGSLTAAGDPASFDGMQADWRMVLDEFVDTELSATFLSGAVQAFESAPGVITPTELAGWSAVVNENAQEYQRVASNRIVGASAATWADVQAKTVAAIVSGVEIPKLRKEIEGIGGFARNRAQTIARTETLGAYNGGDWEGAMALGEFGPVEKTWLATRDARTRPSHLEINGKTIPMDEKFQVGASSMLRPHGAGGSAKEVVNCRCVLQMLYPGDVRPDGSRVEGGEPVEDAAAVVESPAIEAVDRGPANRFSSEDAHGRLSLAEADALKGGFDPAVGSHLARGKSGEEFMTDKVINSAMKREGMDGPPRIGTPEEIDDLIANDWIEAYRGGSADAMDSYLYGDYEAGLGIHGNGFYTAAKVPRDISNVAKGVTGPTGGAPPIQVAKAYARSEGEVVRMAVNPSARIINEDDLNDLVQKMFKDDAYVNAATQKVLDPGRVAAANGFDAIAVANGEYLVVLNREVTVAHNMGVLGL